jgi:hypothetical protein
MTIKTLTMTEVRELLQRKQQAPAKPQTAPAKPQMSEAARQSRERLTAKFALYDQLTAIAREYGEPLNDEGFLTGLVEAGTSPEEARREYAKRAAIRQWTAVLQAVQSPMH